MNNALKEYDDMKEETKKLKNQADHQRFQSVYKAMLWYGLKCKKRQKVRTKSYKNKKQKTNVFIKM